MCKPEPCLNVPATALAIATAAAAMLCSPALALPVRAASPGASPTDHIPRVTVTATRETPHVKSTFPAQGAKVAPGLLVLRVTYDTHMRPDGWAYAEGGAPTAYPDCAKAPRLLDDKETFVLVCRTLPGKTYAVWFNRPPLVDFASLSRQAAAPYELKFTTSEDEPIRTLADAVKADPALVGQGEPVQAPGQSRFGQDDSPGY